MFDSANFFFSFIFHDWVYFIFHELDTFCILKRNWKYMSSKLTIYLHKNIKFNKPMDIYELFKRREKQKSNSYAICVHMEYWLNKHVMFSLVDFGQETWCKFCIKWDLYENIFFNVYNENILVDKQILNICKKKSHKNLFAMHHDSWPSRRS
jgi:hypothetical protein